MNGIVGIFHPNTLANADERAQKMLAAIAHRGPDRQAVVSDAQAVFACCGVGAAGEPDLSGDGLSVVMDGEILNGAELGRALGVPADTEPEALIRAGFKAEGCAFFSRIHGPFTVAISDAAAGALYLARDGFGVKPLYYTENTTDGALLFASELKAFCHCPGFNKALNRAAIRPFLTFEYSSLEETFFSGAFRVNAGECVRFDKSGKTKTRFFTVPLGVKPQSMDEVVGRIKAVLEKNRPDEKTMAELGGFLSGGVDSSYLTALYRPGQTFSVGVPGETANFNETNLAQELSASLGIPNHTRLFNAEDAFANFENIQYHNDEPQANPSAIALWFLAEHTKKYVDTAVSGEGADEIFAGYHWYNKSARQLTLERVLPQGVRRILAKAAAKLPANRVFGLFVKSGQPLEAHFIGHAKIFQGSEVTDILQPAYLSGPTPQDVTKPYFAEVQGLDDLSRMRYLDFHLWSPGEIMQKADRMCMAHGLKTYMPFIDREMMAVGMSAPRELLIAPELTKIALRRAAESVVPKLNAERTKLGFEVPVRVWLRREPFASIVKKSLNDAPAAEFFKLDELNRLFDEHKAETHNHARKLWTIFAFLTWYRRYFGTKTS